MRTTRPTKRRTSGDEIKDAVRSLDEAIAEAKQAQKHLLRVRRSNGADPGIAQQARRSTEIAKARITEAHQHVGELVVLADQEFARSL